MKKARGVALAVLVVSGAIGGTQADTLKDLQGAWAMEGVNCEEIFRRVGKKLEFKDRIASTSTGLLFTGNKVAGPMAVCNVTKIIRKKASRFSAELTCQTSMIVEEISLGFDFPNSTTLKLFSPFGDDMYVTYQKCNL
jgi:hypothetical protein